MNENTHRTGKTRSIRVGVIPNGIQSEDVFNTIRGISQIRYIRALPSVILRYDVLIVPSLTDQVMLYRLRRLFIRYLHLGGVLVLLGVTTQGRRWLPLHQWEQMFTQSIVFHPNTEDGSRIFKNISNSNDLRYHSKYVGHGSILPNQGDEILASDNEDRTVMVVSRLRNSGVLFVTTLDPDYHTFVPVPGPAEETVEITHRKARRLLQNIVNWAIWAAQSTPKRYSRHFLGFVLPAVSFTSSLLFYLLPLAVFAALWFDPRVIQADSSAGWLVTAISLLGSLVTIYSVLFNLAWAK
jgi:hypothetical protein